MSMWNDPQYKNLRQRVYEICNRVERDQLRINAGLPVAFPDARAKYVK
jgi:hypothetical protein